MAAAADVATKTAVGVEAVLRLGPGDPDRCLRNRNR